MRTIYPIGLACVAPSLVALAATLSASASAESVPASPTSEVDTQIDEVLVEGEYPGPGLWKVMRADDPSGHVLWILGEPPPLPKEMKWQSSNIEEVVGGSQEILLPSALAVQPDERIGFFKGMSLLPAALGARRNPDKAKLKDVLPADLYARWRVLKKAYLPRNNGIERWRPIFAADKLRGKAFSKSGFGGAEVVRSALLQLAEKHGVKVTTPSLHFAIPTKTIKAALKAFSREHIDDIECFETTLDLVEEISDEAMMHTRAHAWATADLAAFAAIAPLSDPGNACGMALLEATIAQDIVPADIATQMIAIWMNQAEKSLAENPSTLAVLPLSQLTSADGYLAKLREKQYVIVEPGQD